MIAASDQHTSRAGDPHRHRHVAVLNKTLRADGVGGRTTLDSSVLFDQKAGDRGGDDGGVQGCAARGGVDAAAAGGRHHRARRADPGRALPGPGRAGQRLPLPARALPPGVLATRDGFHDGAHPPSSAASATATCSSMPTMSNRSAPCAGPSCATGLTSLATTEPRSSSWCATANSPTPRKDGPGLVHREVQARTRHCGFTPLVTTCKPRHHDVSAGKPEDRR